MKLYGFFYTSCVYESAMALVSIHHTKLGALRAMIAYQYRQWEELRAYRDRGLHIHKGFWKEQRREQVKLSSYQKMVVESVDVMP